VSARSGFTLLPLPPSRLINDLRIMDRGEYLAPVLA
jgi:hypothetical protein